MRIYEDLRLVHARLGVAQYGVLVLLGCLLLQYWNLQVLSARHFRDLAERNRMRNVALAAPRGLLLDRHGDVVAENRASFNVLLTPEHSPDPDRALARLSPLLGVGEARLREAIAARRGPFRPAVLMTDASDAQVAAIEARRLELQGVAIEVVPLRSYPLGEAVAHPVGRVGEVTDQQLLSPAFSGFEPGALVGQSGIELRYNGDLLGRDGERRVVVNSRGAETDEAGRTPPIEGPTLRLALDARLQAAMLRAFAGLRGAAVALDPRNGDVLGLLSVPAYDANRFATGLVRGDWQQLVTDPATPLMNRVVQGQYAPGSVFKIVVAAAGLEEGLITPDTSVYCRGAVTLYGTPFRCNRPGGHGTVKLREALAQSCNVYFYLLGVRLEIERLARYARLFGLGSVTGIDLPHEAAGLVPDTAWKRRARGLPWYPGETVSVAIGQGQTLVTPVQLARLVAIVAGGGRRPTPILVTHLGEQPTTRATPSDLGLAPQTLEAVRSGLCAAVDAGGTAWRARLQGFEVCGKTGSAQVVARDLTAGDDVPEALRAHAWFAGYAPAEDPRIAVAVLVEHGVSGGVAAAPVARQILAAFLEGDLPAATRVVSDSTPSEGT